MPPIWLQIIIGYLVLGACYTGMLVIRKPPGNWVRDRNDKAQFIGLLAGSVLVWVILVALEIKNLDKPYHERRHAR